MPSQMQNANSRPTGRSVLLMLTNITNVFSRLRPLRRRKLPKRSKHPVFLHSAASVSHIVIHLSLAFIFTYSHSPIIDASINDHHHCLCPLRAKLLYFEIQPWFHPLCRFILLPIAHTNKWHKDAHKAQATKKEERSKQFFYTVALFFCFLCSYMRKYGYSPPTHIVNLGYMLHIQAWDEGEVFYIIEPFFKSEQLLVTWVYIWP